MSEKQTEGNVTELPQICYQRTIITLDKHDYINIDVKGPSLDECMKFFVKIMESVDSE